MWCACKSSSRTPVAVRYCQEQTSVADRCAICYKQSVIADALCPVCPALASFCNWGASQPACPSARNTSLHPVCQTTFLILQDQLMYLFCRSLLRARAPPLFSLRMCCSSPFPPVSPVCPASTTSWAWRRFLYSLLSPLPGILLRTW